MPSAPPFSPHDRRLLNALFLLRGDLTLLAQQESTHILDLIAWSESPGIQTAIAKMNVWLERSDDLRRSDTHREAIDKLVHLLKTTTNPIELRRTATTILRGPRVARPASRGGAGRVGRADHPESQSQPDSLPPISSKL